MIRFSIKPKGFLLGILIVYHSWIRKSEGMGIEKIRRPIANSEDVELKFFQRIQNLNLDWEEILGSYKNVSAEVKTALCKNGCRTTIALWVLQSLNPCDLIQKADCPKGLVCCLSDAIDNEDGIERFTYKPKGSSHEHEDDGHDQDHDEDNVYDGDGTHNATSISFVPYYDENDQIYYPEPILDPIPNDESSEILKV